MTDELIPYILITIIALLLCSPPSSASLTVSEYVYSTGGQSSVNAQQWANGDQITSVWGQNAGVYKEGAAGQQIVTGPGHSTVSTEGEMSDGYTQSTVVTSTGQMAAWDTLAINSLIPNESEIQCTASEVVYYGKQVTTGSYPSHITADGQVGVMGDNGRYESDKTNIDESYGLSGRADLNGSFYGDFYATSEKGADKDTNTLNSLDTVRRHVFGGSADRVSGKVDWIWDDYTQPLNTTANVTETVNVTNSTED